MQLRSYLLLLLSSSFALTCRRADHDTFSTKNEVVVMGEMLIANPNIADDISSYNIHTEVWQGLNMKHPKTANLIPVLASLPSLSEDKLTYTYFLDLRAKWSDDTPVTIEDVIFTFKSVTNPYGHSFIPLGRFLDLDSVWSEKPGAVSFHFTKFKFNRSYDIADVFILPKRYFDSAANTDHLSWQELHASKSNPKVRKAGELFSQTDKSRETSLLIGSGPYIFTKLESEKIILTKNPHYWAEGIPWLEAYPDRLVFLTYWNSFASITALKGQQIDLVQISSDEYLSLLDSVGSFGSNICKDIIYDANIHCIAWNTDGPILSSVKVRKALTMLLNRDIIISKILHGMARKIEGPVSFVQPGWNPNLHQPAFDPHAAKELLKEDGWTDSDGDGILDKEINGVVQPLTFLFLVNGKSEELLIFIEELRKAGIEARLSLMETSVMYQNLRRRNFDACLNRLDFDPTEPDLFEDYHSSQRYSGGSNICCYTNSKVDSLIISARIEFDRDKRLALTMEIQRLIVEDQPMTYLFSTPKKFAWVDRFDNVQRSASAPWIDPRYFIVRGSGIIPLSHL